MPDIYQGSKILAVELEKFPLDGEKEMKEQEAAADYGKRCRQRRTVTRLGITWGGGVEEGIGRGWELAGAWRGTRRITGSAVDSGGLLH